MSELVLAIVISVCADLNLTMDDACPQIVVDGPSLGITKTEAIMSAAYAKDNRRVLVYHPSNLKDFSESQIRKIVIHEIAHFVTDNKKGKRKNGHGSTFRRTCIGMFKSINEKEWNTFCDKSFPN